MALFPLAHFLEAAYSDRFRIAQRDRFLWARLRIIPVYRAVTKGSGQQASCDLLKTSIKETYAC
jgi:hypothetical protein